MRGYRHLRLSGLGLFALDPATDMVPGYPYVFHFKSTNWLALAPDRIQETVAADSNFHNPVAGEEPGGFQVRFIYTGISALVADAGLEMQHVISDRGANGVGHFSSLYFFAAEGGPADAQPVDAAPSSNPGDVGGAGDSGGGSDSGFSWGGLIAGMGVGGTVAVGAGLLWLFKK